jgi:hypothetical protein
MKARAGTYGTMPVLLETSESVHAAQKQLISKMDLMFSQQRILELWSSGARYRTVW